MLRQPPGSHTTVLLFASKSPHISCHTFYSCFSFLSFLFHFGNKYITENKTQKNLALQWKCHHFDIFIIGCTVGCHFNSQWQKYQQNDKFPFQCDNDNFMRILSWNSSNLGYSRGIIAKWDNPEYTLLQDINLYLWIVEEPVGWLSTETNLGYFHCALW